MCLAFKFNIISRPSMDLFLQDLITLSRRDLPHLQSRMELGKQDSWLLGPELLWADLRKVISTIRLWIFSSFSQFSSVAQSYLTLRPHGPQHARPPCPSPTPGVHSDSHPSSQWCHPAISSSVVPFSSCPQSLPASGSFQMSQLFASGGQSFSFNISPSSEHPGLISFRMDWLDLLAVQRTLKSLLQHHSSQASILQHSAFFTVQLSHPYMTTGKIIALTRWTFVGKVMSLLFNILSSLVITFLPRSKCLLISWLQSPSAVILEPPKIKSATVCTVKRMLKEDVHWFWKLKRQYILREVVALAQSGVGVWPGTSEGHLG